MSRPRLKAFAQNLALLLGSCLLFFLVIESWYRLLDPFPFISQEEINLTEYGNLSMYDPELGWKGVPGGKEEFVSENVRIWLANNSAGFRDIEHENSGATKPAIVFLGDSFTWGYEIEFDEMFVNRVRANFPGYETFNLAHRGYGTDQEMLTFKRWRDSRPLKLVVLMFSENDVENNSLSVQYLKPKPQYRIVDDKLVLTNVPVPKSENWAHPRLQAPKRNWKGKLINFLSSHSYFLHDVFFRYSLYRFPYREAARAKAEDFAVTSGILRELKREVEGRGARLVVFLIPSKREVDHLDDSRPYQVRIAEICQKLGIEHYDLAPDLEGSRFRTYYRYGGHWNVHGNQVAAEAITKRLVSDLTP